MDITQFLGSLSGTQLVTLFFKAFAVVFSAMFLIYAIVLTRQIRELNNALTDTAGNVIVFITSLEIIFALVLIVLAILLI